MLHAGDGFQGLADEELFHLADRLEIEVTRLVTRFRLAVKEQAGRCQFTVGSQQDGPLMTFSSSRTFPGQRYRCSSSMAAGVIAVRLRW